MNIKKIIFSLIFVLTLFSASAYAKTMQFTMGDYDAKVDEGNIVVHTMEVAPYTVQGRTMVPARIIAETFGADVDWIETENKVLINLGDKKISLVIGDMFAKVNDETVSLDVPSVETNGRTLVPLRFVSEALDFDIKYLPSTQQILITDDVAPIEVNDVKISLASFDALYDLCYLQYGEMYDTVSLAKLAQLNLLDYAIYTAEADKWDIEIPTSYYQSISTQAAELGTLLPDTLDAILVDVMEIQTRAYILGEFLAQLYLPDVADAEEYYEKNYMAAKHILIKAETPDALTKIKGVMNKLNNGGDFDKLMAEYSEDPGLATSPGGYYFTTGEMVAEFEDAVKKLKVGKVSGIVKTDYGYHIIKRIALPEFGEEAFEKVAYNVAINGVAEHYDQIASGAEINTSAYTLEELVEICK